MKYNAKTCHALLQGEETITDPKRILKMQHKFYSDLYKKNKEVNFTIENTTDIKISETQRALQQQKLTYDEITLAVSQLNNGKTPGVDGIPIEFFKVFWSRIGKHFYRVVEEVYKQKHLYNSALLGIINLIPKLDKYTKFLKNLHLITLLCCDYKIIEKAMANRFLPALEEIIHSDQRGFIPERRISVNIRKNFDLIYYTEQKDISAFIMSLDFQKAFDKISFEAITGAMKFFEFGDYLIQWADILYTDFKAKIQNNGFFTDRIDIQQGVHQGGLNSSLFFLLCAELLAIELRNNDGIKGIPVKDIINYLNQYADDADIFSLFQQFSYNQILETLERYRLQVGFTPNYDKTSVYRIGSITNSDAKLFSQNQVNWTNEPITVLGITVSTNEAELEQLNYTPVLRKVESILKQWSSRSMSIIGKINIINTLVASLFYYKMTVLPAILDELVKKLEKKFEVFIWNGARLKIPLHMLQAKKEHGGLNLVNLKKRDMRMKITWIQALERECDYAILAYENIILAGPRKKNMGL